MFCPWRFGGQYKRRLYSNCQPPHTVAASLGSRSHVSKFSRHSPRSAAASSAPPPKVTAWLGTLLTAFSSNATFFVYRLRPGSLAGASAVKTTEYEFRFGRRLPWGTVAPQPAGEKAALQETHCCTSLTAAFREHRWKWRVSLQLHPEPRFTIGFPPTSQVKEGERRKSPTSLQA